MKKMITFVGVMLFTLANSSFGQLINGYWAPTTRNDQGFLNWVVLGEVCNTNSNPMNSSSTGEGGTDFWFYDPNIMPGEAIGNILINKEIWDKYGNPVELNNRPAGMPASRPQRYHTISFAKPGDYDQQIMIDLMRAALRRHALVDFQAPSFPVSSKYINIGNIANQVKFSVHLNDDFSR